MFVNADLIAAGLAPFAPETAALQAGRLMLQELQRHFYAPAVDAWALYDNSGSIPILTDRSERP